MSTQVFSPVSRGVNSREVMASSGRLSSTADGSGADNGPMNGSTGPVPSVDPVTLARLRKVSKNLFGTTAGQAGQYARDKIKEMNRMDSERWNFDFEKGVPLDGGYEWKLVTPGSVPMTYEMKHLFPNQSQRATKGLFMVNTDSGPSAPENSLVESNSEDVSCPADNEIAETRKSLTDPAPVQEAILVESGSDTSDDEAKVPSLIRPDSSSPRITRSKRQTTLPEFMSSKKRLVILDENKKVMAPPSRKKRTNPVVSPTRKRKTTC